MLPASMSSGTERVFLQKAPDFLLGRANRATLHLDLLVASFQEQAFMHTQVGNEVRLRTKKNKKNPAAPCSPLRVPKAGSTGAAPSARETPTVGKSLLG